MIIVPIKIHVDTVRIPINLDRIVMIHDGEEPYTGPYSVTPTQQRQVLPTATRSTIQDIVVEPIPNNYGLITYNGFGIMVS